VPGWERLLAETGVAAEDAAFMGDDVNDLDVLQRAGLAACPADAHPDVKSRVRFVAPSPAGRGAARDLCELILRAKGLWKT
jgi:3-deoxy-D-manno-octulosonate 8-phosphate phosphatase (KDO 8-P phosphatase)